MIPRTIHYCWFGDKEKPAEVLRMIANWQKHCPGYEIKEWNENNFDIRLNRYCEEAYATKKWAFVSDVARLWALVHEGGVYMDTDVELVRPLDRLLTNKAFLGFEGTQWVGTNLIGAEPSHSFFIELLKSYDHRCFITPDGKQDHQRRRADPQTGKGLRIQKGRQFSAARRHHSLSYGLFLSV